MFRTIFDFSCSLIDKAIENHEITVDEYEKILSIAS